MSAGGGGEGIRIKPPFRNTAPTRRPGATTRGFNRPPLAVRHDDVETAGSLIRASGANVKATNRYGVTPLSLACVNGNAAMIESL